MRATVLHLSVIMLVVALCSVTESSAAKGGCWVAADSFSQNVGTNGLNWSGPCTFFSSNHPASTHLGYTDYAQSASSDDVWQCIQEVHRDPDPPDGSNNLSPFVLEHYWVFPNLPAGDKYLVFEGHASPNSNDSFQFYYNLTGPSVLNMGIPGAFIPSSPDVDGRQTIFITTTTSRQSFYVLIQDQARLGDQQVDQVHIDYLAICKSN